MLSVIRRNLTLLLTQWISTQEKIEADFLSRHRLQRCDNQTSPIRDSEDFPETANLAYTGCFRVQWELSDSQEHDLGAGLQGNGNQCPGLLLGSRNLDIPPSPPLNNLAREGVLEQQIMVILISPGWKGEIWWPQLIELRTEWLLSVCQWQRIDSGFPSGVRRNFPGWIHFMLFT